mmetsp:Transcript_2096/g.5330  ORF Transcript_2096/g.5330 Transcript_2096/m.5330 type:complete len:207 (+) Transcript_2096:108-728(+)
MMLKSAFSGVAVAPRLRTTTPVAAKPAGSRTPVQIEAKKVCDLTGTKRNKANSVCFSNKHSRKWQEPNLQHKKVFWANGQRWVKLKITTRALKTIEKNGLDAMAREAGVDLWKLPFEDARPQRLQYLAENKGKVPVAQNPRKMKNPEKLAASKKLPKYPVYEEGGRIIWIRPGTEELVFGRKDAPATAAPGEQAQQELKVNISGSS